MKGLLSVMQLNTHGDSTYDQLIQSYFLWQTLTLYVLDSTTHPHADFHADCAFIHPATSYLCSINIFVKTQCDPQLSYHHSPTSTFHKELIPIASSIPMISHCFHSFLILHCTYFSIILAFYILQHKLKFFHFIDSTLCRNTDFFI